jgi:hypothetical protein
VRKGLTPTTTKAHIDEIVKLDRYLFDTSRYAGLTLFLTLITYGEEDNGTISRFSTNLDEHQRVHKLEPVASMRDVPRKILRVVKHSVDLQSRLGLKWASKTLKARVHEKNQQIPCFNQVIANNKVWSHTGDGWRSALGAESRDDHSGLVASIPEMMALLHLKHSYIDEVLCSPLFEFSPPLTPKDGSTGSEAVSIARGMKLLKEPNGAGHPPW